MALLAYNIASQKLQYSKYLKIITLSGLHSACEI